jgi:RNA recognition motif-containing protein
MKVYVGNLPWSVDSNKLKDMFSVFGDVTEATVIMDKFSGRSKGFGFVTFANKEDAEKAISEMNEKEVEGRNLKVNEAKPMDPDAPRRPRREFGGSGGGDRPRRDFGDRPRRRF